jgi:hypothetical protein
VANSLRSQATSAAAKAGAAAHLSPAKQAALQRAMTDHALGYGFGRGFLVAAGIMLLALVITVVAIRIRRSDLEGVDPLAAPAS